MEFDSTEGDPLGKSGRRFDSWKAIAVHLGRDVRTVQRWEKESQLPVHRLKHGTRSTVYAWAHELDAWMASRSESPAPPPSTPKPRRIPVILAGVGAVAIAIATISAFLPTRGVRPQSHMEAKPLTSQIGLFWSPRLSPDGSRLVYVRRIGNESANLVLRNVGDGEERALQPTPANEYSPAWSPDGSALAFLRGGDQGNVDVVLLSLADGTEHRLATLDAPRFGHPNLSPPNLDWSPDGRYVAVPERAASGGPFHLALIDVKSGEKTALTSPPENAWGDTSPRFSPDGSRMVYCRHQSEAAASLILQSFDSSGALTGDARRIVSGISGMNEHPAWTPDGQSIVFTSGPANRFFIASTDARVPVERLPYSDSEVKMPDFRKAAGGTWRMTFIQSQIDVDMVRIPLRHEGRAVIAPPPAEWTTVADSTALDMRPALSPDGRRMAFNSTRSGSWQVWVLDLDSGQCRQISHLPHGQLGQLAWTPDGAQIAFVKVVDAAHQRDIFLLRVSDGRVTPLVARGSDDRWISWSRDGRFLNFTGGPDDHAAIWRVPAGRGSPAVFHAGDVQTLREIPDGGFVQVSRRGIGLLPHALSDAPVPISADLPYDNTSLQVTASGLYFVTGERQLLHYSFAARKLSVVAVLPKPVRGGIAVTKDESAVVVCQAEERLHVMLADNAVAALRR